MTTANLKELLDKLTVAEKKKLLQILIADLDESQDQNPKQAWLEVAKRRYKELKYGPVTAIPAGLVIAKAKDRLRNVH